MGTEFVNENEGGENHVECNLRCFGSDVAVEHGHLYTVGGLLHILLVIAVIVFLSNFFAGRRV